jgi:hypothetical protein
MSLHKPTDVDFVTARNFGMANFEGDPEVARDLGIPITAEDVAIHLASGREVASAMRRHATVDLGQVASAAALSAPDGVEHAKLMLEEPLDPQLVR